MVALTYRRDSQRIQNILDARRTAFSVRRAASRGLHTFGISFETVIMRIMDVILVLPRLLAFGINDANMLVSLVGDVRICQIVNPLMTCRLDMPKSVLATIGIRLPDLSA